MSLAQIIVVLKARLWLIAAIWFALVAVVATLSLVLPKHYSAAVSLVVDAKAADPVTGALLPVQMLPGYLPTQIDIIRSHSVALKVVDRLHLADLTEVREQFHADTGGAGTIRDWLADQLLDKLDARPSRESNVVEVSYSSADPQAAAAIANAFAEAYIRTSLELKVDPARQQAGWFDEQVAELRKALEGAQQRLSQYQSEHKILASDAERLDLENVKLAELSSQLVAAQNAMYAASTRRSQMGNAAQHDKVDEMPDILANPLVQNLKAELVRSEAKLADIGGRYGTNHPLYVGAVAERDSLLRKLTIEMSTAKGSINQAAAIADRQVGALQSAVEQQKARVLELNQQRDKLAILTRDVESARTAYDAVMGRKAHVRLESEINQTDIAVLNPAIPPLRPVFPMLALNLVLAVVLGLLVGAAVALLVELADRRLRLPADLAGELDIAVLAVLQRQPRIRRHKNLPRLAPAAGPA